MTLTNGSSNCRSKAVVIAASAEDEVVLTPASWEAVTPAASRITALRRVVSTHTTTSF
jgi:hypothetical protein